MRLRIPCLLAVALFAAPVVLAQNATDEAQAHLQRNAFRYGLVETDLTDLAITDTYTSRQSGTTHVYLRQQANGIEIIGAEFTVALDRKGHVFHAVGNGASALAQRALATSPSVTAEAAAAIVARDAGLSPSESFQVLSMESGRAPQVTLSQAGIAEEPVTARLVYHLDRDDNLALAWQVGLYERGAQHYWQAYIDAESGRVLAREDLVIHDTFGEAKHHGEMVTSLAPLAPTAPVAGPLALAGSYRVYPYPVESPNHGDRVLIADADDAEASPFGWHDTDGSAGAEYTISRGNNVHAYQDSNNSNSSSGDEPDGGASLLFDFPIDLNQEPSAYRPASVTNLFYWNNIYHDIMWHYGFDEPSGNFQVNNYGRGGVGNDDVRAEAQDGGGTCNANFFTPSDGSRPRMQMYISSGGAFGCNSNPVQRDGSLDNAVIIHEYAHGVSNRLVGGPSNVSCLGSFSTPEQMGEGWSDLYGLLMSIEPGDTGADARGIGTWLFGQGADGEGIRDYPYSTDMAVNPQTYAFTRTAIVPHGVGSVWAEIAWEVTWELIDNYGFDLDLYNFTGTASDAGNVVMMALLTEGMKLMPCNPGFVDARDGILAADQALYGGLHIDDLWAAFARRGLGIGADQGSSGTNSDNVEDFAEPETIPPTPVTDLAASAASLGITLNWTATGDDGNEGTASSYDIRYSTSGPITNDADFDAASQVDGEPAPQEAGSAESFTVTGLAFATEYWFAMKVSDNSFNTSEQSNSASATTLDPPGAQISTAPITVTTPPNTQATASFSIGNNGQSGLTYALDFTETTPAPRIASVGEVRKPSSLQRAVAEVKDAVEPRGTTPMRGSGGPDAYGYNWIDSDEPGGPTYDWVDISETGTSISLSDDDGEVVTLPFAFDFYGDTKTSIEISSNGYLTFGSDGSDYTNDAIPTDTDPNDFIAPFWDDLDPGNSGTSARIYYQDMGDGRFVVSWEDIPHYPNDGSFTFQAILYASGQMLFQYAEFMPDAGDEASATIGLENADATDGLQVVYNAPYVHENLAIRISAIWVSADPGSGLVDGGSSDTVELTFDASGLAEGSYTADMTVTTNDPSNPTVIVPIVFNVGDAVDEMSIELTPANPPVVVPKGGTFDYTAALTVPEGGPSSVEVWAEAIGPDEITYLLVGPITAEIESGVTTRMLSQYVNRGAAIGDWTFTMKVGAYPDDVITQDDITGMVTPAEPRSNSLEEWVLSLADGTRLKTGMTLDLRTPEAEETAEAASTSSLPTEPALYAAYPNPVGTTATVRYDVAESGTVRIVVYDLLGREVAVLADGSREAGQHAVTLDTRSLPSGTYILRMTAGSHVQSQRVTVVR